MSKKDDGQFSPVAMTKLHNNRKKQLEELKSAHSSDLEKIKRGEEPAYKDTFARTKDGWFDIVAFITSSTARQALTPAEAKAKVSSLTEWDRRKFIVPFVEKPAEEAKAAVEEAPPPPEKKACFGRGRAEGVRNKTTVLREDIGRQIKQLGANVPNTLLLWIVEKPIRGDSSRQPTDFSVLKAESQAAAEKIRTGLAKEVSKRHFVRIAGRGWLDVIALKEACVLNGKANIADYLVSFADKPKEAEAPVAEAVSDAVAEAAAEFQEVPVEVAAAPQPLPTSPCEGEEKLEKEATANRREKQYRICFEGLLAPEVFERVKALLVAAEWSEISFSRKA